MGCTQNSPFCPNIQNISLLLVILLILISSTHARFMPQGRSNNPKVIDNDTQVIRKDDEEMGLRKVMIGSRPPTCEWKKYCGKCGKCEAIQVPIAGPRTTNTRKDDISNYKPMGWKCKCGDFTFNP